MVKAILLLLFLTTSTWANDKDIRPLDLYKKKQELSEKPFTQTTFVKGKHVTITIKNINEMSSNSIFPVFPQLAFRDDYEILVDKCSYQSLKPQKSCEIVIVNKKNNKVELEVFPYGKENLKTTIKIGKKNVLYSEVDTSRLSVNNLTELPLVERIGVESSYTWVLDLEEDNLLVVDDLKNLHFKLAKNNTKWELTVFPLKEDFFNVNVKLYNKQKLFNQPLKFTSLVRKPLSVKISPIVDHVPQYAEPVIFYLKANFMNGHPLVWTVPKFLINWQINQESNITTSGLFNPERVGKVEIKGEALGVKDQNNFEVIPYWPFGLDQNLVVKSGETKILQDKMIYDFSSLVVEPRGTLILKFNNPWFFIGAKKYIINNGIIKFIQPYSGDLSSNIPNIDGSLSGLRIPFSTLNNSLKENGGVLYLKAFSLKGRGVFEFSRGNLGGIYIDYLKNNDFKGVIKGQILHNQVKKEQAIIKPEPIAPVVKKSLMNFVVFSMKDSLSYLLRYLFLAGIPFLVLYIFFKNKIKVYKIQENYPNYKQYGKEFFWSVISALVINFIVAYFVTGFAQKIGWTKVYSGDISKHGTAWYFISFLVIIMLHDLYFYWTHRVLHTKWFYNKFHYIHHKSDNPTPLTALSFHPMEAFMHFLFLPIAMVVLPFHSDVVFFFLWTMLAFNVNGHSGYEYWPKWMRSGIAKKIINNSFHHNQHHSNFNCNYSLYFNLLDRWFKTNHSSYDQEVEKWPKSEK